MVYHRPWGQAKPDDADTADITSNVLRDWKRDHPGATLREFWLAVAAGEVALPGAFGPDHDPTCSPAVPPLATGPPQDAAPTPD
jgi:hypothetical protein